MKQKEFKEQNSSDNMKKEGEMSFARKLESTLRRFFQQDNLFTFLILSIGAFFITYQFLSKETSWLIGSIVFVFIVLFIKKYGEY